MFSSFKKPTRLGQWNGRRRSSRTEEGVLPTRWQLPVLLRLATVVSTLLAVTGLTYQAGPTMSYRIGEVYPSAVRVRAGFKIVNQPQTNLARAAALKRLPASQLTRAAERERVARSVPVVVDEYGEGQVLVPRGEPVTEGQMSLLKEEHEAYLHSLTMADHVRRGIALFLIMTQLALVAILYCVRFQLALTQSVVKVAGVCALVILTLALELLLSGPPWHAVLLPLTTTAMILTIAYNPQFALLMSFSLSLATTVALGTNLERLLIQMGGLATAILLLRTVRTRTRLVQVGFGAGFAYLVMTMATGLLLAQPWRSILWEGGGNLLWGAAAGFLLTGSLPLVERCFSIITDVRLLELADGSHALLQELVRRAPGTYTHSMTVATLAEGAAEAIGANPLLARVGSYFHDVGKMLKPQYFIENQCGENRHDSLEPALSTLVIIGHIKDGLALARQYDLPSPITDFIEQHHGTTLVEYFYREALRLLDNNGEGNTELEASFRYPGPKPRNRENGIVMLADAVESSSRTLKDPAPGSLRKLVHDLLMKRLLDGQFEESGLTLTELHLIEESLATSLAALYHGRIRYPGENQAETVNMRRAS
jgi:putative nucleotidyltransferase with HDIG domain